MHGSIKSCVKISPNTVTAPFPCNKGIRQGDGLSPVLFSLYMNDIPNLQTDKKCLGIKLEDQNINCLMYADDLTLISTSANDLQHSLDVLEEHPNNWKLKINVKKSSIMIFNKDGQRLALIQHGRALYLAIFSNFILIYGCLDRISSSQLVLGLPDCCLY